MVKQDYLMRMLNDLLAGMSKMIFHKDLFDGDIPQFQTAAAEEEYRNLTLMADEGKIEEAFDKLESSLDEGDREMFRMALYFFEYINRLDEDTLEQYGIEREDVQDAILDAADKFGYRSLAETLI